MASKRLLTLEFTRLEGPGECLPTSAELIVRLFFASSAPTTTRAGSRSSQRAESVVALSRSPALRGVLIELKTYQDHEVGLVFGPSANTRLRPSSVRRRALKAWKRAELEPADFIDGPASILASDSRDSSHDS